MITCHAVFAEARDDRPSEIFSRLDGEIYNAELNTGGNAGRSAVVTFYHMTEPERRNLYGLTSIDLYPFYLGCGH